MTKANFNKLNSKINVALHQAQLSGDGGAFSKSKCSTSPDGYDGRLKQGERDGTAYPGQHVIVLNIMLYSKQVGKAIIENGGLPTKTTESRKHQRCKRG